MTIGLSVWLQSFSNLRQRSVERADFANGGVHAPRVSLSSGSTHICQNWFGNCSHNARQTYTTVRVDSLPHRKWRKIKQQPSMLPGPAVPGCC